MNETIRPPAKTNLPWAPRFLRDPEKKSGWFPRTTPEGRVQGPDGEYIVGGEPVPKNYKPPYNFFSLEDDHPLKRRIPNTSVINRVSDTLLWGEALQARTAADLIVRLNTLAMVAYALVLALSIWIGYDKERPDLKLHVTRLGGGWNFSTVNMTSHDVENAWRLVDAELRLSVAALLVAVLCIELLAVVVQLVWGVFERYWYIYWRQLDDGFAWWRWLHWAVSDGLLVVTIALVMGVREVGILGCFFVLVWTCFMLGFVNELYSRPRFKEDLKTYAWPAGPVQANDARERAKKRLSSAVYSVRYGQDPRALKLISQDAWEGDRPLWNDDGNATKDVEFVESQRSSNYNRRMLPYALGLAPGVTPWAILTAVYFRRRNDLKDIAGEGADYEDWHVLLFFGCAILSWSKALILPIYEYIPPAHFWGSDYLSIILNLALKMWFSLLLLLNVLNADVSAEDTTQRYQL